MVDERHQIGRRQIPARRLEGRRSCTGCRGVAHIAEYSLRAFADPDRLAAAEAALKDQFLAS
jgi:hypothetical protein